MVEAFFRRDGERFVPGDAARGPWNRESLHGRVLSGLLGYAVERDHGDAAFQVARLTVDMFRVAPHAPATVSTRRARDGNRIRVVDAALQVDGTEVARATAVMLRRTDPPAGTVWTPDDWHVPAADTLPVSLRPGRSGPGEAWETRYVEGGMQSVAQKRAWLRQACDFVEGEPVTPFVRVAAAADFANPLANSGDRGLNYVNADVTLYLHRLPVGEWIGLEVASHQAAAGVAVGECALYDTRGAIGRVAVCAVAQTHRT